MTAESAAPKKGKSGLRRVVAVVLSVLLLAALVKVAGREALLKTLREVNLLWFGLGLLAFVPQIGVIGLRWKRLVQPFSPLPLSDSVKLVLASNTANLVLPSKMGDLAKGWFLSRDGAVTLARGMGVVVFEKLLDVATLATFMLAGTSWILLSGTGTPALRGAAGVAALIGLIAVGAVLALRFAPLGGTAVATRPGEDGQPTEGAKVGFVAKVRRMAQSFRDTMAALRNGGPSTLELVSVSALIWVLHLAQIGCFFVALQVTPSVHEFLTLVPLAIFLGLVPLTIAGFGTRDAALVALFPAFPAASMVGVALLINLRYIVPALAGWPFLHRYVVPRTP